MHPYIRCGANRLSPNGEVCLILPPPPRRPAARCAAWDVPLGEEFGVLLRLYRKPFDKRRLGDHVVPEVRHRHELSFFDPAQHRALSENARKSGRIICQRPREKYCGLLREFPGGKIEPGETAEAVLL